MGLFDKVKGMLSPFSSWPKETPFLDECEDMKELAGGSMSKIYRAHHKPTKEIRIVKRVTPSTPEAIKKLQSELEICLALDHPNVVRYLAYEKRDGAYCILMEMIEGTSLRDFLLDQVTVKGAQAPFVPYHFFTEVFHQAAKALAYIHEKKCLHMDIKPENIMVVGLKSGQPLPRKPVVKIVDFGVAVKLGASDVPVGGSVFYIAPEVIQGGGPAALHPRVDLYALGATMYELATGEPPFLPEFFRKKDKNWMHYRGEYDRLSREVRSAYEKELLKNRLEQVVDLSKVRYPDDMKGILGKCLELSFQRRYAMDYMLVRDLDAILNLFARHRTGVPKQG